jgi:hypothetical protein
MQTWLYSLGHFFDPSRFTRNIKRSVLLLLPIVLISNSLGTPSFAVDYSCINPPGNQGKLPKWSTSGNKDLTFVVSWAFKDPEKCILGLLDPSEKIFGYTNNDFYWDNNWTNPNYKLPTKWTLIRDGEMVLVSAESSFPIQILESLRNRNLSGFGFDIPMYSENFGVKAKIKIRQYGAYQDAGVLRISAGTGLAQLWGIWFSKNQGIFPMACSPKKANFLDQLPVKVSSNIVSSGRLAKIEIRLHEPNKCILFVHAGPMIAPSNLNLIKKDNGPVLSTYPYWDGEAPPYFEDILGKPNQLVQVGIGDYVSSTLEGSCCLFGGAEFNKIPQAILSHSDSVKIDGNEVVVTSSIEAPDVTPKEGTFVNALIGFYVLTHSEQESVSGGWSVNFSGNSWTARYFQGGVTLGGWEIKYLTRVVKIPTATLFVSAADKAAADKAAADKAAADKAAADKAAADKAAADKAAADKAAADKAAAVTKKIITCVKGKIIKKVSGVSPKCPNGYKKK